MFIVLGALGADRGEMSVHSARRSRLLLHGGGAVWKCGMPGCRKKVSGSPLGTMPMFKGQERGIKSWVEFVPCDQITCKWSSVADVYCTMWLGSGDAREVAGSRQPL